jgi:hypothetical protein
MLDSMYTTGLGADPENYQDNYCWQVCRIGHFQCD